VSSPIRITRNTVAVVLLALVVGLVGFVAGALLRGVGSLAWLNQLGTILLAAIPALAAYVRGGKIQAEVATIKQQTNGTTAGLVDVTGRAVEALAAIAKDPASRARAAELLRAIEAENATPPATPPPAPPPPVVPSPPG
jgi:hypothetical protein